MSTTAVNNSSNVLSQSVSNGSNLSAAELAALQAQIDSLSEATVQDFTANILPNLTDSEKATLQTNLAAATTAIQTFTTSGGGDNTAGWMMVFVAMANNLSATQNYVSSGVTPLGTIQLQIQDNWATFWNGIMSGADEQAISAAAGESDPNQRSADVQKATSTLSVHTQLLSQSNSFWNGLNQGTNQTASDVSGTQQLIFQMMSQGILQTLQTITQII